MNPPDKNIFSIAARKRLIDLGWSIEELAGKIRRPRSTVSKAIHSERFPLVRKAIANKLSLSLPA